MNSGNVDIETTTPLISIIEDQVKDVPGWSPIDQLYSLALLTISNASIPGDILEIGSWCGRSACVLGLAARTVRNTQVHCVDLFPRKDDWYQNADGTYSFRTSTNSGKTIEAYNIQTVWKEPFEKDIAPIYKTYGGVLEAFNLNIRNKNLSDIVTPFRGSAEEFLATVKPDQKYKLAFIDGDHSYEAVCKDIEMVERFLAKDAWICFDDAFTTYEGVNNAIRDRVINSNSFFSARQLTRKFFAARKR